MRPDTQITTWSPTHWIWGKIIRSLWEGFEEFWFRISARGMGPRIVIWEVIESNKVIFTFSFGQWPLEETGEGRGGCNLQPDEVSALSLHLNNTRCLPIVRESLAVLVWPMSSRTFPSLLRQSCWKMSLVSLCRLSLNKIFSDCPQLSDGQCPQLKPAQRLWIPYGIA